MADAAQAAIEHALKNNWRKAIEINRQIIEADPLDIEALNRLAFALTEIGETKQAKQVYNKVLSINRFNTIALKNLKRLSLIKGGKNKSSPRAPNGANQVKPLSFGLFLEEVGKTKVITLINLAEAKVLSTLYPTNEVILVPRRKGVAATTPGNEYIGALPDDIARRLFVLMKGGNTYEAYIKSVNRNEVSIFIRETLRKRKFRNQPSFLGKGSSYYPFVREEAISGEDKPDVSRLEDLDEGETADVEEPESEGS